MTKHQRENDEKVGEYKRTVDEMKDELKDLKEQLKIARKSKERAQFVFQCA